MTSAALQLSNRLLLTPALQQAFQVLQMPLCELAPWLEAQIAENPLLEWDESPKYTFSSPVSNHPNIEIPASISLFSYLMKQARETFSSSQDLFLAEQIIGNLDEHGFFTEEMKSPILSTIQTFDPPGIAAKNLQESLLLQLERQDKKPSLAYTIIDNHFSSLLQGRLVEIQKQTRTSLFVLQQTIREEIAALDFSPGSRFTPCPVQYQIPDATLLLEEGIWHIEIHKNLLPSYRIKTEYINIPTITNEEKSCLRKYLSSAQWISQSIQKRNLTLKKVLECILKVQGTFLAGVDSCIKPLTIKEVAATIGMHESTIARAVSQKTLSCPLGVIALRSLFSQSLSKTQEEISCDAAKKTLRMLISQENKQRPLSDQALIEKMREMGICCARRTITKYRKQLRIPSRRMRKCRHL